jgi:uncharacterized protein DUF4395
MSTTARAKAESAPFGVPNAKRNFIVQQGLRAPATEVCAAQYSALLFQPRLVALWLIAAIVLQSPRLFVALGAVLWWSALAPALNPFDALYNRTLTRSSGTSLGPAPAPRRFAQFLAGSFSFAIGLSLVLGWSRVAAGLEAFFVGAVGALVFGGFCLGSYVFHLLSGRADFARRTLPWASGR